MGAIYTIVYNHSALCQLINVVDMEASELEKSSVCGVLRAAAVVGSEDGSSGGGLGCCGLGPVV